MQRTTARRAIVILLLLAAAFALLELRLAWVQLAPAQAPHWSARAVRQRTEALVLDDGRGRFVDRRGEPLAGVPEVGLAAFPAERTYAGTEPELAALARALGTDGPALAGWLNRLQAPAFWPAPGDGKRAAALSPDQRQLVEALNLPGVEALPHIVRYPAGLPSLHAIGYVSQHPEAVQARYGEELRRGRAKLTDAIGGAGLERSLDRWLRGAGPTAALRLTDTAGRELEGLGRRMTSPGNAHFPLTVGTTLDLRLQRAAEQMLDRYGVEAGAVVVLDVRRSDVLAMASRPRLDPYRIGAPGTDERNHALTAYPPGSVFKTVTLAAALEAGIVRPDERFRCTGHYGRYGLRCWRKEGHGVIGLTEAYAQSCNVVFAALAERLDPRALQETAERLGLGRRIGWQTGVFADGNPLRLMPEEEEGAVFADLERARDGGVRTGTGIGQRDVRVTPLQAANLAAAVARGGRLTAPRLVRDIRYADGRLFAALPEQSADAELGPIRPETAAYLRRAMTAVVADGTAERALSDRVWPLAGKSGTAEAAAKDGSNRNHHWFIGYGPANDPRYAAAVLIENQPAGLRNRAGGLFGELMDAIAGLEERAPGDTAD